MAFRPPQGHLARLIDAARTACTARKQQSYGGHAATRPKPRGFRTALLDLTRGDFPLICEIKRASPSAGSLAPAVEPSTQAQVYVSAGARCVSVLTEGSAFHGSLQDLREVRAHVPVPLLRKDFIVDPFMVEEAAEAGADAVLLIAAAVEPSLLLELAAAADTLGLDVLLELTDERDLEVLGLREWKLVGINARNLETLELDATRFARLSPHVAKPGRVLVAESGLSTPEDIVRVHGEGARAALVGEALMRAANPAGLVASMARSVRS